MKGTRPGKLPPPSESKEGGRICTASGCNTHLSIYNLGDYCWQHAEVSFPNHRGKRLAPKS